MRRRRRCLTRGSAPTNAVIHARIRRLSFASRPFRYFAYDSMASGSPCNANICSHWISAPSGESPLRACLTISYRRLVATRSPLLASAFNRSNSSRSFVRKSPGRFADKLNNTHARNSKPTVPTENNNERETFGILIDLSRLIRDPWHWLKHEIRAIRTNVCGVPWPKIDWADRNSANRRSDDFDTKAIG